MEVTVGDGHAERQCLEQDCEQNDDGSSTLYFIGSVVEYDDNEYDKHYVDRNCCEALSNHSNNTRSVGDDPSEAYYSCRGIQSGSSDNGNDKHGAVGTLHPPISRTDIFETTNWINAVIPSTIVRGSSNVSEDLSGAFHSCREAFSDDTSRVSATSFHTARDNSTIATAKQDPSLHSFTTARGDESVRRSSHGSNRSHSEFLTCHEPSERSTTLFSENESFHTCHRMTNGGLKSALSKIACDNDNIKLNLPLHVFTNINKKKSNSIEEEGEEDAAAGGHTQQRHPCDKRSRRLWMAILAMALILVTTATVLVVVLQSRRDRQSKIWPKQNDHEFTAPVLLSHSDPPSSAPTPTTTTYTFSTSGFREIFATNAPSPSAPP